MSDSGSSYGELPDEMRSPTGKEELRQVDLKHIEKIKQTAISRAWYDPRGVKKTIDGITYKLSDAAAEVYDALIETGRTKSTMDILKTAYNNALKRRPNRKEGESAFFDYLQTKVGKTTHAASFSNKQLSELDVMITNAAEYGSDAFGQCVAYIRKHDIDIETIRGAKDRLAENPGTIKYIEAAVDKTINGIINAIEGKSDQQRDTMDLRP